MEVWRDESDIDVAEEEEAVPEEVGRQQATTQDPRAQEYVWLRRSSRKFLTFLDFLDSFGVVAPDMLYLTNIYCRYISYGWW